MASGWEPSLARPSRSTVNSSRVDIICAQDAKSTLRPDPATGKLIGTCPELDTADVEKAIQAASEAFPKFRTTLGRERARMLRRWYQLMIDNAEDLAKLITWENGKP